MRNTDFEVLREASHGMVNALSVVRAIYPRSRQPFKKAKTFHGHLRRLLNRGWVEIPPQPKAGPYETWYRITVMGRTIGLTEWRKRSAQMAPRMRLVDPA